MNSFHAICPELNPRQAQQTVAGVEVLSWGRQQQAEPGDVVVEMFGCHLLPGFVDRIQQAGPERVRWLNLEHLSAEPWVEDAHLRPSPQPGGINKLFFFPGFTAGTGGLLREADLLSRRDAWQALPSARRIALRSLGLPPPPEHAATVLLFSYARGRLDSWLDNLSAASRPTVLWVCPGPIMESLNAWLTMQLTAGQTTVRGSLTVAALPYVPQERFDEILWAADLCIVRGEDSFVRAQWAARPLLWHIYPQEDDAHMAKLDAFLTRYLEGAAEPLREATRDLWMAWNEGLALDSAWDAYLPHLPAARRHAQRWCRALTLQADLATQLRRAARDVEE